MKRGNIMIIKFKNMQPGMKQVVDNAGNQLATVVKVDGEIAIDHIQTAYDDDATIWPNDNDGKPLKTYKQALEYLQAWFNVTPGGIY